MKQTKKKKPKVKKLKPISLPTLPDGVFVLRNAKMGAYVFDTHANKFKKVK